MGIKRKTFLKIFLVAGLVWKWMPVFIAKDGNGVYKNESN